jgi:hypothetical protein
MPGIDRFLSQPFELAIKKNLDQKTEHKMKQLIFQKYGISIRQSIEDLEKLLQVTEDILGTSNSLPLKKILAKIFTLEKSDDGKSYIVKILDDSFKDSIMKKLGDPESREILEMMMNKSYSTPEVLKLLSISTTSGYRKINNLIHDGYLYKSKSKFVEGRRPVDLFTVFCSKIFFELQHNNLILFITINKKNVESSSVFKQLLSVN